MPADPKKKGRHLVRSGMVLTRGDQGKSLEIPKRTSKGAKFFVFEVSHG